MLTVLVTGCRSGIGLQTALAFARRGDQVYAGVRDPAAAVDLQACAADEQLPRPFSRCGPGRRRGARR